MKADRVGRAFADPRAYLRRRHYQRWRSEAVASFVGDERFARVIDYGCGDGSVSIPLLGQIDELVLVDTSPAMLEAARGRLRDTDIGRVSFVDTLNREWRSSGADLVLCVGLLAHVPDPWRTLDEVASLVRPGGAAVIELTDANHPLGWGLVRYSRLRERFQSERYAWNEVHASEVLARCADAGLVLRESYAYGFPIRLDRILGDEAIYRLGRWTFGPPRRRAPSWLSCERLYYLRR